MSLTRRQFAAALGAASAAAFAPSCALISTSNSAAVDLTVIAYNVQACTGWPADRRRAEAAVAEMKMPEIIAAELSTYKPDIISFSESPSEPTAKEIARLLAMNHVRFPSGGDWPGTILSRFPVESSANVPLGTPRPADLFTRHWGRATLTLPEGPLIVHSAHLYPSDPARRLAEIRAMLSVMLDDLKANRSMLLMGDLNHEPSSEEYKLWVDAGWVDTFAKVGQGNGFTRDSAEPRSRIDYVFAAGPLASRIVESRPLFEGAFRLDLADPEAFALSDHLPQLARFSS